MLSWAVFAVIIPLGFVAFAQTSSEPAAHFGHFDGKGYAVAPDVRLVIEYGHDHTACRWELRSAKAVAVQGSELQAHYESDVADRVLNEVAPVAVRKGSLRGMIIQSGCSEIRTEEYDNVAIARVTNECSPVSKKNVESLVINWKSPACQ